MTETRIMQTSAYLGEVMVEERQEGGMVSAIAVVDETLPEEERDVMVFEPFEPQDAIAFADGYAYCKMMGPPRRSLWRRITSLIRRYTP